MIVKVKLPEVVGVPVNAPAEESVSPEGNVPAVTENEYGDVPPLAEIIWL